MPTTFHTVLIILRDDLRLVLLGILLNLKIVSHKIIVSFLLVLSCTLNAHSNTTLQQTDSIYKITAVEKQRLVDSVKRAQLEGLLSKFTINTDNAHKQELQEQLDAIDAAEKDKLSSRKSHIDSLRGTTQGHPVVGVKGDTLFLIYSKIGASTAKDRAFYVSNRIETLYKDDFFEADSMSVLKSDLEYDIVYGKTIIMSVSEDDALWYRTTKLDLANTFEKRIKTSIVNIKEERKVSKILVRFGIALVAIFFTWLLIRLLKRTHRWVETRVESKKEQWLKNLNYKDYTFLSGEQELQIIFFLLKIIRWAVIILVLYIALPIVFSIFPISRHWADVLFHLIWTPFKTIIISVWEYMPNLFRIFVIYIVMKYVIKAVRYIFGEIGSEKLNISGFHSEWAAPTYGIIKFLLYAFMFVIIFPFLPGSDSHIFKGVSVFIGILFSLGSSTAISNMVAGLVITYMRPFIIGDRIKIADVTGDVIEKSLLVTRIITSKHEVITIPNASVLSGNTINYSREAGIKGLILHTTVTIGYDVPWNEVHQALIDAALRTEFILEDPKPFVHQTSLDDFYVAYQLNAYTREATKQGQIYSELHQNIQDVFNEKGIEIMSPHYRAERDGNATSIPEKYR